MTRWIASFATLVVVAVGGCDSSSPTCAPEGTYAPTVARGADPGSCPLDMKPLLEWKNLEVGPSDHACGTDSMEVSGTRTSSSGDLTYCSYEGTIRATASSDGIVATAKLTFHPCTGADVPSCTANYLVTYAPL